MSTIALEAPAVTQRQLILVVEFRSPEGRTCTAVGGGPTDAAAIAYARESCPAGTSWGVAAWNDLYGE